MKWLIGISCVFLSLFSSAQLAGWKAAASLPMQATFMTVDELGNVYVVKGDNDLVRYNESGDSTGFFRSVQNGAIGYVDATNPLRLVVYYPAYSKLVLLDRMLAAKNELDLRNLNIPNVPVVATSADGNIWIYDVFNARLKKINAQLEIVSETNDMRLEAQSVPMPSCLVERDWKVFLADTASGIFTFDRYGNYLSTLALRGVKQMQVLGSQIIYYRDDSLFSWDLKTIRSQVLPIPATQMPIINAAWVRNTLYVLYADRLVWYKPDER